MEKSDLVEKIGSHPVALLNQIVEGVKLLLIPGDL
jgi:hypothetical protein